MIIIAVDENRDDLDLISDLIYDADPDSEIIEYEDPLAALGYARQTRVDVAFIAIQMSDLNGLELGKYLKELNPSVNIIFLSEDDDDAGKAMDMHASGYVVKPAEAERIEWELEELRYPEYQKEHKRVFAQTFGNFDGRMKSLIRRSAMADKINLRKILISDSSELRKRGLMEGTIKLIEDDIRALGTGSQGEAMLAFKEDVIYALVKLFRPDRKNCRAHIDFVFTADANADTQSGIVDEVLRYCFLDEYYHKVTVICNHGNEGLERILMGAGFNQEAVLRDEVRTKTGFEDAGLYAMLSYEYPKYNVCFVPFERGVAVVTGGVDYIDSVKLFHYGQQLEDPFENNVASSLGLLDGNMGLVRNDDGIYNLDSEQLKYLPSELAKAYVELKEYFDSNRAGFDINVRFSVGTPFQKKVWNALNSIPYGGTASYEDIALILTDGKLSEARKITRAVGSACSDNPVAVIVPCHRVIGKDGSIVGYSAGIDIKDYLLLHESFTAVTPLISKEV